MNNNDFKQTPVLQVSEGALDQWFQTTLLELAKEKRSPLSVEEQLYAADLCSRFARSEIAFGTLDGQKHLEPLALLLRSALECEDETQRIQMLRRLGDVALFTSGFFAERVEHRGLAVDYFVSMGEMAYSNVSSLARRSRNSWRELYERLGKNFKVVMHLLWDFVQTTSHAKNTDLLAAYREWERTGNARLHRLLLSQGFALPHRTARG